MDAATRAPEPLVRAHALATQRLLRDPDAGFTLAVEEAKRVVALGGSHGSGFPGDSVGSSGSIEEGP